MCLGFLPVLLMPLHNWVFGHQFVLLSTNADLPSLYVMPPSAYGAALVDLLRLDFGGAALHRALAQIAAWLSEPSELPWLHSLRRRRRHHRRQCHAARPRLMTPGCG